MAALPGIDIFSDKIFLVIGNFYHFYCGDDTDSPWFSSLFFAISIFSSFADLWWGKTKMGPSRGAPKSKEVGGSP